MVGQIFTSDRYLQGFCAGGEECGLIMHMFQHLRHNHCIISACIAFDVPFDRLILVRYSFGERIGRIIVEMVLGNFDHMFARIDGCDIRVNARQLLRR